MLECNNVTRVRVEPKWCDLGVRNNDAFDLSASVPTNSSDAFYSPPPLSFKIRDHLGNTKLFIGI